MVFRRASRGHRSRPATELPTPAERPRWRPDPAVYWGGLAYFAAVALTIWLADATGAANKLRLIALWLIPIYLWVLWGVARELAAIAAKVYHYPRLLRMARAFAEGAPLFDFGGATSLHAAAQRIERLSIELEFQRSRLQLDLGLLAGLAGALRAGAPEEQRAGTIRQTLYEFLGTVAQLSGPRVRGGSILLLDAAGDRLRTCAANGLSPAEIAFMDERFRLQGPGGATSAAAAAIVSGGIEVVNIDEQGVADSAHHLPFPAERGVGAVRSYVAVALPPAGPGAGAIGVLCLDSTEPHAFDADTTRASLITLASTLHLALTILREGGAPRWYADSPA